MGIVQAFNKIIGAADPIKLQDQGVIQQSQQAPPPITVTPEHFGDYLEGKTLESDKYGRPTLKQMPDGRLIIFDQPHGAPAGSSRSVQLGDTTTVGGREVLTSEAVGKGLIDNPLAPSRMFATQVQDVNARAGANPLLSRLTGSIESAKQAEKIDIEARGLMAQIAKGQGVHSFEQVDLNKLSQPQITQLVSAGYLEQTKEQVPSTSPKPGEYGYHATPTNPAGLYQPKTEGKTISIPFMYPQPGSLAYQAQIEISAEQIQRISSRGLIGKYALMGSILSSSELFVKSGEMISRGGARILGIGSQKEYEQSINELILGVSSRFNQVPKEGTQAKLIFAGQVALESPITAAIPIGAAFKGISFGSRLLLSTAASKVGSVSKIGASVLKLGESAIEPGLTAAGIGYMGYDVAQSPNVYAGIGKIGLYGAMTPGAKLGYEETSSLISKIQTLGLPTKPSSVSEDVLSGKTRLPTSYAGTFNKYVSEFKMKVTDTVNRNPILESAKEIGTKTKETLVETGIRMKPDVLEYTFGSKTPYTMELEALRGMKSDIISQIPKKADVVESIFGSKTPYTMELEAIKSVGAGIKSDIISRVPTKADVYENVFGSRTPFIEEMRVLSQVRTGLKERIPTKQDVLENIFGSKTPYTYEIGVVKEFSAAVKNEIPEKSTIMELIKKTKGGIRGEIKSRFPTERQAYNAIFGSLKKKPGEFERQMLFDVKKSIVSRIPTKEGVYESVFGSKTPGDIEIQLAKGFKSGVMDISEVKTTVVKSKILANILGTAGKRISSHFKPLTITTETGETLLAGYHATPTGFPTKEPFKVWTPKEEQLRHKRDVPGLYVSAYQKGASMHFLRLPGDYSQEFSLKTFLSSSALHPQITLVKGISEIQRIPGGKSVKRSRAFLYGERGARKAARGIALIEPKIEMGGFKGESQVVLPPELELAPTKAIFKEKIGNIWVQSVERGINIKETAREQLFGKPQKDGFKGSIKEMVTQTAKPESTYIQDAERLAHVMNIKEGLKPFKSKEKKIFLIDAEQFANSGEFSGMGRFKGKVINIELTPEQIARSKPIPSDQLSIIEDTTTLKVQQQKAAVLEGEFKKHVEKGILYSIGKTQFILTKAPSTKSEQITEFIGKLREPLKQRGVGELTPKSRYVSAAWSYPFGSYPKSSSRIISSRIIQSSPTPSSGIVSSDIINSRIISSLTSAPSSIVSSAPESYVTPPSSIIPPSSAITPVSRIISSITSIPDFSLISKSRSDISSLQYPYRQPRIRKTYYKFGEFAKIATPRQMLGLDIKRKRFKPKSIKLAGKRSKKLTNLGMSKVAKKMFRKRRKKHV